MADDWRRPFDSLLLLDDTAATQPIKSRVVYRLTVIGDEAGPGLELLTTMAKIGKKGKGAERRFTYDPWDYSEIREKDRAVMALAFAERRLFFGNRAVIDGDRVDAFLRLLAGEEYAFTGQTEARAQIHLTPVDAHPTLIKTPTGHRVGLALEKPGWLEERYAVLGSGQAWITDGRNFAPFSGRLDARTLRRLAKSVDVPDERWPAFVSEYLDPLVKEKGLEIRTDEIGQILDDIDPRPVLTLADAADSSLKLELALAYGDGPPQVEPDTPGALIKAPIGDTTAWVRRQTDRELEFVSRLSDYGVEMSGGEGRLETQAALDFIRLGAPKLIEAGWEVIGKSAKLRLGGRQPEVRTRVSSGIDWFDLAFDIGYGDTAVSLPSALAAYRSGHKYVQLADGAWGVLPAEWLAEHLPALTELDEKGLENEGVIKVRPSQVHLADDILAAADSVELLDDSWAKLARALKDFDGLLQARESPALRGELRDYQRQGLAWLKFLSEFRLGGVLADDMGLGKTIQTIALLLEEQAPPGQENGGKRQSLIIAPTSVAFNWAAECGRFAPDLKILKLTGPRRHERFDEIDLADVVITTYALVRRDFEFYAGREFHYVILDEAQYIKNAASVTARACKALSASRRLALTGTPMENSLGELWSIVDFLMPGTLGSYKNFQSRYEKHTAAGGDEEALDKLKRRLRPFVLRRTKEEVAVELPAKTEIVQYCSMTPPQRALYDQLLNTSRARVLEAVDRQGINRSRITVLDALLKLRQVCCHPRLLKVAGNRVDTSGKLEMWREMVKEIIGEGHRALVFSQFTKMLAILKEWLDHEGIPYQYLDGRTRDRQAKVDAFMTGDAPLFLISLKAGGTGLNLTAADYVVHFDPW